MAQRAYCCRTRIRALFTLCILAALTLFMVNIITQMYDIPPSSARGHQTGNLARQETINMWRKERGAHKSKPIIDPVPCRGSKCAKFMGVFGMDESSKGSDGGERKQHCKHPLFLPENDTIHDSFYSLPPLGCEKVSYKCGYHSGQIRVADGYSCLLQTIERPEGNDNSVIYSSPEFIATSMSMPERKADHFRLSCASNSKLKSAQGATKVEKMMYLINKTADIEEQHYFTHLSQYPEGKPEQECDDCLPYNVLILGIGSLSQMSFRRMLPNSHEYFTSTLSSFNFEGYNVVGEGSSGALLPLLSGLDETSQPEIGLNHEKSHFVDKLNLLWNAFDNHGYMTLYAEDHPKTNTFNERFHGFEVSPTAHYMRPFWLAAESSKQSRNNHCLGNKPKHQYTLDYLLDFHEAYTHEKRFALAMLKDITEGDVNAARHLDEDLLDFMKKMNPYLENTIIILMSDHGVLPKKSLSSWQSKAEARMPLLSIYLPTSFINNYSDLAHKMISNEDKLITPYDVHMTLKDLIDIPRLTQADPRDTGRFGQSLFKAMPLDRTCELAGVNVHWCACHTQFKVQPHEVDNDKISTLMLTELNEQTAAYRDHCEEYKNVRLLTLTRIVPNEQIKEHESKTDKKFTAGTLLEQNYYQVTFEALTSGTSKGQGHLYEATFEHNEEGILAAFSKSYKLVSDIISIDKSHSPSTCSIPDKDAVKFCSCIRKRQHADQHADSL